jgi:hypothetical protein
VNLRARYFGRLNATLNKLSGLTLHLELEISMSDECAFQIDIEGRARKVRL